MNEIQKKYRLCPECYELSEEPGYCRCGGFKRLDCDDLKPEEKKMWEHGFETAKRLILEEGDGMKKRPEHLVSEADAVFGYNQALTDYQERIKQLSEEVDHEWENEKVKRANMINL